MHSNTIIINSSNFKDQANLDCTKTKWLFLRLLSYKIASTWKSYTWIGSDL